MYSPPLSFSARPARFGFRDLSKCDLDILSTQRSRNSAPFPENFIECANPGGLGEVVVRGLFRKAQRASVHK
jgi:hypothetical protein